MPLPSLERRSGDAPGSPTGEEKGTDASEAGAHEAEFRVGGALPIQILCRPDNLRVRRKGILGQSAASVKS